MAETAKQKIQEYLNGLPESEAQKILRYLEVEGNYEIVVTDEDKKIFERGRREIEKVEYKFI